MIFKRMNEIEGDFILKVKVSHDFKETYDSASVMVMVDDANGCNLEGNSAQLQVCRVGNNFAFHYSADGINFYMMRYFHLPAESLIKVGLLAQASSGNGGKRIYEHLSIEHKTVKNIRSGK